MAKEETLKLDGVVTDVLPNAMFRVDLETGQNVIGYISGKMRQHDIKILLGDTVEVLQKVTLKDTIIMKVMMTSIMLVYFCTTFILLNFVVHKIVTHQMDLYLI